jgi:hypothetical protein
MDASKHIFFSFSEPIKIIHEIDQEKLFAQSLWKRWLRTKFELAPTQREIAVPLVIVDDSLVVKPNARKIIWNKV